MTDKEILRHCKKILKENSYISVAYQIKNVLKIKPEVPLVRRIRAKLLENPEYIETPEYEQEGGYRRIRLIKLSPKEKYPFIHDVSVALIGGVIGAVATWILTPKPTQEDRQAIQ